MKTNYIKFILAIVVALGVASCKKELQPVFYSQLTSTNFPKTLKDADKMLNDIYYQFYTETVNRASDGASSVCVYSDFGGWCWWSEVAADGALQRGIPCRFNCGLNFDITNSCGNSGGSNCYSKVAVVSQLTVIIDVIEKMTVSAADTSLQKQKIAEGKCLRWWFEFLLYDFFGPVLVIRNADSVSVKYTNKPRPTSEEFFKYIEEDFKDAIPHLLEKTNGTSDWGRVNKGVARLLLAKLYMNAHRYAEAKPYIDDIINMENPYEILPKYNDVFYVSNNNEVIWARESKNLTYPGNFDGGNAALPSLNYPFKIFGFQWPGNEGGGSLVAPWDFYDRYTVNDKRRTHFADKYYYIKSDNDTVFVQRSYTTNWLNGGIYGAYFIKDSTYWRQDRDNCTYVHPMRYGDVVLMKAEIEAEISGKPSDGISWLQKITDRAGTTAHMRDTLKNGACTLQEFRNFLCDERGRELFWEGWRRMDMIRIQSATKGVNKWRE